MQNVICLTFLETAEEMKFLCEIFLEEGIVCITDEIYEHIIFPPHKHICAATLPGMRENTLVVQSGACATSTHALP